MNPADNAPSHAGSASEQLVGELLREFAQLEGKRGIWEKHWEEVAQKVLPYYSTSFYLQGNTTPGLKRGQEPRCGSSRRPWSRC